MKIRTKLKESEVLEIVYKNYSGQTNKSKLGREYRVDSTTINKIILRETWAHLDIEEAKKRGIADRNKTIKEPSIEKRWGYDWELATIRKLKEFFPVKKDLINCLKGYIKSIDLRTDWNSDYKKSVREFAQKQLEAI